MSFTIETSRTGLPVLKRDGRFLASSIDPVREATAWADRVCAGLSRNETVIVLGLGSGYHVAELLERKVSTLVIERDAELIAKAITICATLAPVSIVTEPDWTQLIEHASFREAVCGSFRIAPHGSTVQMDSVYYTQVEALLLARDPLSFLLMLKTRPELLAQLEPSALAKVDTVANAISIKTLTHYFGPQSTGSRERRLWRILEELVV